MLLQLSLLLIQGQPCWILNLGYSEVARVLSSETQGQGACFLLWPKKIWLRSTNGTHYYHLWCKVLVHMGVYAGEKATRLSCMLFHLMFQFPTTWALTWVEHAGRGSCTAESRPTGSHMNWRWAYRGEPALVISVSVRSPAVEHCKTTNHSTIFEYTKIQDSDV